MRNVSNANAAFGTFFIGANKCIMMWLNELKRLTGSLKGDCLASANRYNMKEAKACENEMVLHWWKC